MINKKFNLYATLLFLFNIFICIFSSIKAEKKNETLAEIPNNIDNIENLNFNMHLNGIKEKIHKEFSKIASAYADFHEAILDFFNKIIFLKINSEEVKLSYLKLVQANNKLLTFNKGFENDFFKGKISKKITENFFDGLITLYDSWVKSEDITITTEEKEIYQSMIDNYNFIIKEVKKLNKVGKGFLKYKILFKKEIKESVIGSYAYVKVDGIEDIKEKNEF